MTTKKPSPNGVIRFSRVASRPCERIPGGTVVAKADCPVFEEPIGWVVRSTGYNPPGELKFSSEEWHFVPTCGIEPVLGGLRDESEVWTAVRNQYRGIYDLRPGNHDRRIASGDDCEVDGMLLDWCKLDDLWWDHGLSADHSVIGDVVDYCPSAHYFDRHWYGGGPGLSGTWYKVYTPNPSLFQREFRKRLEVIIAEKLAKPPPKPKRSAKARKAKTEETPPAP